LKSYKKTVFGSKSLEKVWKVWKSLEKFGKSLEKFGKSSEKFGNFGNSETPNFPKIMKK